MSTRRPAASASQQQLDGLSGSDPGTREAAGGRCATTPQRGEGAVRRPQRPQGGRLRARPAPRSTRSATRACCRSPTRSSTTTSRATSRSGYPKFNLAKAKQLVVGVQGGPRRQFDVTCIDDTTTREQREAQLIQRAALEGRHHVEPCSSEDQATIINDALGGNFSLLLGATTPARTRTRCTCGSTRDSPVNFGKFNDPQLRRCSTRAGRSPTRRSAPGIYEQLNKMFSSSSTTSGRTGTQWVIATKPNVQGLVGPPLPDGGGTRRFVLRHAPDGRPLETEVDSGDPRGIRSPRGRPGPAGRTDGMRVFARRLVQLVVVVVLVTLFTFCLLRLLPGSADEDVIPFGTPAQRAAAQHGHRPRQAVLRAVRQLARQRRAGRLRARTTTNNARGERQLRNVAAGVARADALRADPRAGHRDPPRRAHRLPGRHATDRAINVGCVRDARAAELRRSPSSSRTSWARSGNRTYPGSARSPPGYSPGWLERVFARPHVQLGDHLRPCSSRRSASRSARSRSTCACCAPT